MHDTIVAFPGSGAPPGHGGRHRQTKAYPRRRPCDAVRRRGPQRVPVATLGLLAVNIGLFCLVPPDVATRLCLLPLGALDLRHVLRAAVAGAWLHADAGLLVGNMVLLGCFGAALEGRIGGWRLVAAGLVGGLIAGLIHLNLLLHPIGIDTDPAVMLPCGPTGASGAIAGLMGLFVAGRRGRRPHLRLPRPCGGGFVTARRANGILLIALFLVRELSGGGEGLSWSEALIHGGSIAGAFAGGMMLAPAVGMRRVAHERNVRMVSDVMRRPRPETVGRPDRA